jgi:hypothetical protein
MRGTGARGGAGWGGGGRTDSLVSGKPCTSATPSTTSRRSKTKVRQEIFMRIVVGANEVHAIFLED